MHTFLIPERKSKIKSYTCNECHTKSLSELKGNSGKKAHWNIDMAHSNTKTMKCTTCHNGDNMNNLNSITGANIDFNKSYNLCNQCHSTQFEDWKGGAYGKQIKSWASPRISLNCVNCYDPHRPKFESRWPSKFNLKKEKERE